MAQKLEEIYKYKLILGIILVFVGILVGFFPDTGRSSPVVLIEIGMIVIIISAFRLSSLEKGPVTDERTKKLSSYGVAYSWLLTLIVIALLVWVDLLELVELTVRDVLLILFLVMVISANVFKWYFVRKADVE